MTLLSLVCLLALSSAVFGRSMPLPLDGYGSTRFIEPAPLPVASGYGREILPPPELPVTRISTGYGAPLIAPPVTRVLPVPSYGGYGATNRFLERAEVIVDPIPPTPADILCRGQLPQTVIPIEGNRKFVVCIDDGKGTEQPCPRGLLFNELTRRCERKLGPPEDFCISQPCLNGGLCVSGDSTFQCQCPAGFDGIVCELDARFCQTNRPCGPDPTVRCQSFRPDAALDYICVFDEDFSYGPDGAHIHRSLCDGLNNGPHPLAFTNKGFMMCNGEHTHFESCPGGTIWEPFNKACVWPDMEEIGETRIIKTGGYGGYGSTFVAPPVTRVISSGYDKVLIPTRPKIFPVFNEVRRVGGYGGETILPAPMPETKFISSGYGGEKVILPPAPITKVISSGYGGETILPAPLPETKFISSGYGGEKLILPPAPITKVVSSGYGGETFLPPPMPETKVFSSGYGSEKLILPPAPITKVVSSGYGGETFLPPPMPETKVISSGYGSSRLVLPPPVVKVASSYGGY